MKVGMKRYSVLILVVLAGVVPFSSRAVFLDEHIFLKIARNAHDNWLFPQDMPGMFFGIPLENYSAHTHPPVGEYVLALIYALLGGFDEVSFRLLYSAFSILAVLSFYKLALRFTTAPLYVSLLFAVTPAFFLYMPTLMMDIPMLAFLLTGFAAYYEYLQGRKWALVLASVCFVLAVGTGYTALVPLGCFFIGLLLARRPRIELISVAVAPLALTLWLAAMSLHFGTFPLVQTVQFFASQGSVRMNSLATLTFLGGVTVFPWIAIGKRVSPVVMFLTLAAMYAPWPARVYPLWVAVLAGAGIAMLVLFATCGARLVAAVQRSEALFLLLWAPATLVFFIVVGDMINARYILLSVPPLYLVIFRETTERRLISVIVPTAFLSVVLAYADFTFVNANRDWVERNVVPLQQQGFRVWGGAESGLRFYLEQRGIVSLTSKDTQAAPIDLVVRHAGFPFRYGLSEHIEPLLVVLKTFTLEDRFPIRTFNAVSRAGMHDSRLGLAPFTLSRAPFDRIEIAQVCPIPGAVYSPKGPVFKQMEEMEGAHDFPMKIPADSKIEYELQGGDGIVAVTGHGFRLIKGSSPVIVWRNFQIVPKQFAVQ
jgi:4-amino-4-deoxy-L-arabinose transferase-like glycosyltransferase